jgi:hypothetical protein
MRVMRSSGKEKNKLKKRLRNKRGKHCGKKM